MPGYGQLGMVALGGIAAAGNATIGGNLAVGDGTTTTEIRISKSDTGTATLALYSAGVLRGSLVLDANENTVIQPPANTSAGTGATTAIRGGLPGAGEGQGGALNLQGADGATATATARNGGAVNITAGAAVSSGTHGAVNLRANATTAISVGHNGSASTIGFFGVTPAVRPTTYAATNVTTDRTYDADATSTAELADVLGTLIADLRTLGLVT